MKKKRQKAFSKIIKNGIKPDAAMALINELPIEGELDAVFADQSDSQDEEMNTADAKKYRGIAARLDDLTHTTRWHRRLSPRQARDE